MGKSVKDKIKSAKLPERVIPLCLRGDLDAQWRDLAKQATDAKARGAMSLEGDGSAALAAQAEAIREQMAAESIDLLLRAMTKRRWDELMAEHPARTGNATDARYGYNAPAFFRVAIRESTITPDLDDQDWAVLLGDDDQDGIITDGQWQELTQAVYDLNKQPVNVPFSFAAWLKTTDTASA